MAGHLAVRLAVDLQRHPLIRPRLGDLAQIPLKMSALDCPQMRICNSPVGQCASCSVLFAAKHAESIPLRRDYARFLSFIGVNMRKLEVHMSGRIGAGCGLVRTHCVAYVLNCSVRDMLFRGRWYGEF